MAESIFKWTEEQKAHYKAKMIEKHGSEEAYRIALVERAKKPRKKSRKKSVDKH